MTASPTSFQPITISAKVDITFSPEEASTTPDFSFPFTVLSEGLDGVAQIVADALVAEGSTATVHKALSVNYAGDADVAP